jgi:uncharacterized RDD family membrane protein YckC
MTPMDKPTNVIGRRIGAYFIDGFIVWVVGFALFFLFADKQSDIGRDVLSGDVPITESLYINVTLGDEKYSIVGSGKFLTYVGLMLLIYWLYYGVLQGIKGWTPGKLALGIRTVAEETGQPAGVGRATLRWVAWIVDSFPWFIPLVGLITAVTTQKNQRVGDMVAKTVVVRADAVGQPIRFDQPGFAGGYGQIPPPGYGEPPQPPPYGQPPQAQQPQQADWYPDPQGQARLRYWDGQQWTEHTSQ